MATNNPYRAFVDGFVRLLTNDGALGATGLARPDRPLVAADAPKALIFAPHPDDEVIIGGLPLRLLRELKMNVVNVAAWMIDNVRRGAELVGGQGGTAPRFAFATLYRLRRWEESRFHNIFEGGKVLSGRDDLSKLFQPQR